MTCVFVFVLVFLFSVLGVLNVLCSSSASRSSSFSSGGGGGGGGFCSLSNVEAPVKATASGSEGPGSFLTKHKAMERCLRWSVLCFGDSGSEEADPSRRLNFGVGQVGYVFDL